MPFHFGPNRRAARPRVAIRNSDSWQSEGLVLWVPIVNATTAIEMVTKIMLNLALGGARSSGLAASGIGLGARYNAAAAVATVPNSTNFDLRAFTVTAVAGIDSTNGLITAMSKSPSGISNGGWLFGLSNANPGAWRLATSDSGGQHNAQDSTVVVAQAGVIYYVVGTREGDGLNINLYVNGRSVSTVAVNTVTLPYNVAIGIGARNDGSSAWNGAIFDLRHYSYCWTPSQAAEWSANPWDLYWTPSTTKYVLLGSVDTPLTPSFASVQITGKAVSMGFAINMPDEL